MTKLILEETVEYLEGNIWSGVKWSDGRYGRSGRINGSRNPFERSDYWQKPINPHTLNRWEEFDWGVSRKNMNSDCDYDVDLREQHLFDIAKTYDTSCSPNESNWMKFRWDVEDAFLPEDGEPTETRSSTDDAFCKKKWLTID